MEQVSKNVKDSVTVCSCGVEFPTQGNKKFCSDACRQKAYRTSSAHAAVKLGKKNQRLNRRWAWVKRRMRDKYLNNLSTLAGAEANGVLPLGMIDLNQFSKVVKH
jgi:hypothetical protein